MAFVEWDCEGRSRHIPPTQHKLDCRKVELIPAKILDCSQRDPENGSKGLKVRMPENNAISIFNLLLSVTLAKSKSNHGVKKVITEIIAKSIRTGNLSLLPVLPSYFEAPLAWVLKKIRIILEISHAELFKIVNLIRFCFRSDSVRVTDAFMKVLGRFITQENSNPVKTNDFNLSVRKTIIEEIAENIRRTFSLANHHNFFKPLIEGLLDEETLITDRMVALLYLLSSNKESLEIY